MKKNQFSLIEIKRYLKKKGLDIIKKKNNTKNNDWSPLSRTIISCIFIITFFYTLPVIYEFKEERVRLSQDFENDSKNNFQKVLKGEDYKLDNKLIEEHLYEDVLEFEDLPNNTVRLSAATIEQLFKDTKYNLNDVRKKKIS